MRTIWAYAFILEFSTVTNNANCWCGSIVTHQLLLLCNIINWHCAENVIIELACNCNKLVMTLANF
jgi:hypothetical protein